MCSCRILGRHAGILWGRRLARLKSSMQRPQFGMTKRRPANSNSSYKISNDRFLHMHVSNKSQFSCHKDRCVTYQIREGVVNQVESDLEGCKGTFQKRFSGFCPLKGYPPPYPLTENQCEKKKDFFLSGIGGYTPPP